MHAAIIIFPGSNREHDVALAWRRATGHEAARIWHRDASLPETDLIILPGGFAYGDYLRCGAMAAHSPIMREVKARAARGTPVLGICNGFQILTEAGLLPGALLPNRSLCFHLQGHPSAGREQPDDLHLRLFGRPDDPGAGGASRRQLHRRPRDARSAGRPRPCRVPLLRTVGSAQRGRQFQRLGPRHRRRIQRQPHRARADAASRERHRPAAWAAPTGKALFAGLVRRLAVSGGSNVTAALAAEHGLSGEEFDARLRDPRPHPEPDRTRRLLGDVERALLVQILEECG